jgi:hypothetical protein
MKIGISVYWCIRHGFNPFLYHNKVGHKLDNSTSCPIFFMSRVFYLINMVNNRWGNNISRKNFLKMLLGAGAFTLGSLGVLGNIDWILNKRSLAQSSSNQDSAQLRNLTQQDTLQTSANYIIYSTGPVNDHTYWAQRTSDGEQLIKNGSQKPESVIQSSSSDIWRTFCRKIVSRDKVV